MPHIYIYSTPWICSLFMFQNIKSELRDHLGIWIIWMRPLNLHKCCKLLPSGGIQQQKFKTIWDGSCCASQLQCSCWSSWVSLFLHSNSFTGLKTLVSAECSLVHLMCSSFSGILCFFTVILLRKYLSLPYFDASLFSLVHFSFQHTLLCLFDGV